MFPAFTRMVQYMWRLSWFVTFQMVSDQRLQGIAGRTVKFIRIGLIRMSSISVPGFGAVAVAPIATKLSFLEYPNS